MKNRYTSLFLWLALLGAEQARAQTSNFGELTVTPNTVFTVEDNFTNNSSGSIINDGEWYAKQNIENNGAFNITFSNFSGILNLIGTIPQEIVGVAPIILNDLFIDNPTVSAAITLEGELHVHGIAEFVDGVLAVDETEGDLFFEENSEHSLTSDFSHVDGKQHKVGTESFVFPCGDNQKFRPAEISSPDVATDNFSCTYFMSNSDILYPHENYTGIIEKINNIEYWDIGREQGSSQVLIGLSYRNGITPPFITNNLDHVHIVRWDEVNNEWRSEGGIHDPTNSMIYTVAEAEDFGKYTLALVEAEFANEDVVVYNLITPDFNGQNDIITFDGLENFEDNVVTIVNRWGEEVFEMKGYDNKMNVFSGFANKGITNMNAPLPDGTYFYVIRYTNNSGEEVKKVGYLQLAGK